MNLSRSVSILSLVALGLAAPSTVWATRWQVYLPEGSFSNEIDADSVHVLNGLVVYQHRKRLVSGADPRFDRALGAVADCAGRREADVGGSRPVFFPVQEGTWKAYQVDAACRLAGLPTTPGPLPQWEAVSDGMSINLLSLKVRDGVLFFDYTRPHNKVVSGWDSAAVDCATRQRSSVVGEHYTLQPLVEGGSQSRQAEDACRLAHLAMPPGPTPAPVDFGLVLGQREAGDDNMLHDIVRTGIVVRDGLVHFQYATRLLSDGTLAQEDQLVSAVVDCVGQRRSDEVAGKANLRPVEPGTRGAMQVERVCKLASAQAAAR